MPAVLRPGSGGEAVRDLQQRLGALGQSVPVEELGRFGAATEHAVRAFQEARGLRVDGVCGRDTWSSLVESGYRLGDRMLYLRYPMFRGDDVTELQRRLNGLGFDAGREDGILGSATTAALTEFQRNVGLTADGVGGPATLAALARVDTLADGSMATVREREQLRRGPHQLSGRRVFVAAPLGLHLLGSSVAHGLTAAGAATTLDASGAEDSALATAANRSTADLFLAVRYGDEPGCRCLYFESGRFRSEAGFGIASTVNEELVALLGRVGHVCGRAYPVLRETRMAAVICEPVPADDLDGVRQLVSRGAEVAAAIVRGVRRGVEEPLAG
jgi:N-acetylmuramoyl-L-alanine amidase